MLPDLKYPLFQSQMHIVRIGTVSKHLFEFRWILYARDNVLQTQLHNNLQAVNQRLRCSVYLATSKPTQHTH